MQLTESEIRYFKNAMRGVRFWYWFRWALVSVLIYTAVAHFSGWRPTQRVDWLAAGVVYLLVAWPGLCRAYSFHTLHRLVSQDPEAREQLRAAGVTEFKDGATSGRA